MSNEETEIVPADESTETTIEESELDILRRERDEFKDIALRVQADFENYRKRAATQLADEVDRSSGRLVEQMLAVLDACEAAVTHGVEGVEPIWSSLLGTLQKQGLEALDLEGKEFDPELAEAVLHEDGEGGPSVVTEVLRTGYKWKGRVLRAAMVKVKG
jgi:molecular chaperone GrpE